MAFDYEAREIDRIKSAESFKIKILADDWSETRWLNITPEQLDAIRAVLTGPLRKD